MSRDRPFSSSIAVVFKARRRGADFRPELQALAGGGKTVLVALEKANPEIIFQLLQESTCIRLGNAEFERGRDRGASGSDRVICLDMLQANRRACRFHHGLHHLR